MLQKDHQLFTFSIIAGTVLFITLAFFLIFIFITLIKRRTQHTLEMTQLKQTYDQELLKSQLEIQEQTFRSISLEIHDNIGQVLSLAKLNLGILSQQQSNLPMLIDTRNLLTKAIADLRDLSKGLSPERVADIDLAESIGYEMQMLEKTGVYNTTLEIKGVVYALPKEKKIILFRILQEVLNNVVKHAGATKLAVVMHYGQELFRLLITDNGSGFDTTKKMDQGINGIGIINIQNRSKLIGATCSINSMPGNGTAVSISLPIKWPSVAI